MSEDTKDFLWVGGVIGGALIALMLIVCFLVIGLQRHYGRVTCDSFASQTGRETKFVVYNFFATGDCLTPTADGKWIPTSNLREFGDKP